MMVEFVPENVRASFMRDRHVEIRPINPQNPYQPQPEAPVYAHYIRTHDRIAAEVDEISLHQAIAAFYFRFHFNDHGTAPTWFKLSFAKFTVCEYRSCHVFP